MCAVNGPHARMHARLKQKICLVSPAPPTTYTGNRTTAERWASILEALGHQVVSRREIDDEAYEILIALHAWKSAASIRKYATEQPDRPLIVAMTGTDLYGHIHQEADARRSLELADRLVLLQPDGIGQLPQTVRHKARVIYQSAVGPPGDTACRSGDAFDVCVIGNLRDVKDPFRAAAAARLLPQSSRIRIVQVGKALDDQMAAAAHREMRENPRYEWRGEKSPDECRTLLATSRVMVLSSRSEGGANVISESVVAGVPVIASRISGTVGLLGADYPGYYPFGDTQALRDLLSRVEVDAAFLAELARRCDARAELFDPAAERCAWQQLLAEFN